MEIKHVPCGRCYECKQSYQRQWTFRMVKEMQESYTSFFCTLTYDDDHLPTVNGIPTLDYTDFQLFMKRFRKHLDSIDYKLRFFCCGEYGSDYKRPHYHAVFFIPERNPLVRLDKLIFKDMLTQIWKQGFVQVGILKAGGCAYVAKYMTKFDPDTDAFCAAHPDVVKPFYNMSRRPGIGNTWTLKAKAKQWYRFKDGSPKPYDLYKNKAIPLPRYMQGLLFQENEQDAVRYSLAKVAKDREIPFTFSDNEDFIRKQHEVFQTLVKRHDQLNSLKR